VLADQNYNNVAHPFGFNRGPRPTREVSTVSWKPPSTRQTNHENPAAKHVKQMQIRNRPPSPSIALSREPVRVRSPSPCQPFESSLPPMIESSAITAANFVCSDPPSTPTSQSSAQEAIFKPVHSRAHGYAPVKPVNPSITRPAAVSSQAPQPAIHRSNSSDCSTEDKATKVAACLRLLDPTKGFYEPKMDVVYKQSPSLGAVLDEENRSLVDRPPSRSRY